MITKNHSTKSKDELSRDADAIPGLVSAADVARRLGIAEKSARRLPLTKVRLGRKCVRYRVTEVQDLIDRRSVKRPM